MSDKYNDLLLAALQRPIPMLLFCPKCHAQHIDAPDDRTQGWDNPPHRSHLCHACGCIWRPADLPTTGVERIETRGKADNFEPTAQQGQGEADELIDAYDEAVRRERESGFQPPQAQQAARDCVVHNRNRLRKALTAPPAQPAERVLDGWREAIQRVKDTRDAYRRAGSGRHRDHMAEHVEAIDVLCAMLAASPAPSPARGDGGEG